MFCRLPAAFKLVLDWYQLAPWAGFQQWLDGGASSNSGNQRGMTQVMMKGWFRQRVKYLSGCSFAPLGLFSTLRFPTACAVCCILTPLRGYERQASIHH
jgi:hypothetical protein